GRLLLGERGGARQRCARQDRKGSARRAGGGRRGVSGEAPRAGEFELIRRYFAPLAATHPAGLGLEDDAAVFSLPPGREIVVTTDTMVEGVHYPVGEAADFVARKLLRVNLSDLAAMGARPEVYFLNTAWPPGLDENWI